MSKDTSMSIDLTALYEYIGDGNTEYGYYIDHEDDEENVWNDLEHADQSTLHVCDGEECKILCAFADCVSVYNHSNIPFWLSMEEFKICFGFEPEPD